MVVYTLYFIFQISYLFRSSLCGKKENVGTRSLFLKLTLYCVMTPACPDVQVMFLVNMFDFYRIVCSQGWLVIHDKSFCLK